MAFQYHGKVESLRRQVEDVKWRVNQRYLEIFGNERYDRLERTVNRILTPESYIENVEDLRKFSGQDFPETTPSKFMFASLFDPKIDASGRLKGREVKIACGFYISEQSFNHSGSSKITEQIVASYIHEYNHLVPMLLQRVPLYLANSVLTKPSENFNNPIDLLNYIEKIYQENIPKEEKIRKIGCNWFAFLLNDCWERTTRILDYHILKAIGIDAPLAWRGKERQYIPISLPDIGVIGGIPVEGDSVGQYTDKKVIDLILRWEETLHPVMHFPYIDNILRTLRNVHVQYMSFPELKKYTEKQEQKRRESEEERAVREYHERKRRKK